MRGRREMATALMACVLLFAGATAVVGTLIEDSRRDGRASIGDTAGGIRHTYKVSASTLRRLLRRSDRCFAPAHVLVGIFH